MFFYFNKKFELLKTIFLLHKKIDEKSIVIEDIWWGKQKTIKQ